VAPPDWARQLKLSKPNKIWSKYIFSILFDITLTYYYEINLLITYKALSSVLCLYSFISKLISLTGLKIETNKLVFDIKSQWGLNTHPHQPDIYSGIEVEAILKRRTALF